VLLFNMLVSIIKHGGDNGAQLARRLLGLDESNATQAIFGTWGLQHLCCLVKVTIDEVPRDPLDIAKHFSPPIASLVEDLIIGAVALLTPSRR
jgi:hypothetical protein